MKALEVLPDKTVWDKTRPTHNNDLHLHCDFSKMEDMLFTFDDFLLHTLFDYHRLGPSMLRAAKALNSVTMQAEIPLTSESASTTTASSSPKSNSSAWSSSL